MQPKQNPRSFFVFFRGDGWQFPHCLGIPIHLQQIRAVRLVRHLVAVSELPQPEGKQEWCRIAELYREEVGLKDWKVYIVL